MHSCKLLLANAKRTPNGGTCQNSLGSIFTNSRFAEQKVLIWRAEQIYGVFCETYKESKPEQATGDAQDTQNEAQAASAASGANPGVASSSSGP